MTTGLRDAMDAVRRSVAVLAARVPDAHARRGTSRLHLVETSCAKEFGISRAQACRLLEGAHTLGAIQTAVTAARCGPLSLMQDTDPDTEAALDYGLSQRALWVSEPAGCRVSRKIQSA
ncbi:hypothetical protein [Streptomyces sp. NPDC058394]|uniref:hypothetical protein n=1 Tax=Streptomyces sp. NPDC058394 TaxID=3346477 RepID=UPI00365ED787